MNDLIPIEELLHEEESTTLDFKRNQYPLNSSNEHIKSEILKDILAFSNAWRRTDGYILLGVEEVKGGRSRPIGLDFELDDAQLQQFINSKIKEPITFSYKTFLIDGVKIGVIRIPVQSRPFFAIKDYGKVKKNVVYVRRGSGTVEATPDEIYSMGKTDVKETVESPNLFFEFADLEQRSRTGTEIVLETTLLEIPSPKIVPVFSDSRSSDMYNIMRDTANSNYYRDLVIYYYIINKSRKLSFSITNNSNINAIDVMAEIIFNKSENSFAIVTEDVIPEIPESHHPFVPKIIPLMAQLEAHKKKPSVKVQDLGAAYRVEVLFEKVQPKQTAFSRDSIYIVVNENIKLNPSVMIYADNVPVPIRSNLILHCTSTKAPGTLDIIKAMHDKSA